MMTQSTCYKGTKKMTVKGILWHSTGANNKTLKRYVQPSDNDPNKAELLKIIGKNAYGNDWNHVERQAGLNFWIGTLADGTVSAVQTMPWDYRPWGCGSGSKGSCNDGWIQFEICEDGLTNKTYFDSIYKEACEMTAYLCQMYNIDPNGTVTHNGVKVPTILCHQDSYKLGLGSNHGDVLHWFKKHSKTMDNVRADVAALLKTTAPENVIKQEESVTKYYRVRKSKDDAKSQKGAFTNKQNAIDCCQTAGSGYHVFDWEWNIVYSYTAPVVAPTLSSIAVTTKPTKTTYTVGDKYDGTGLVVTATYSDKSTKVITGYTVAGFNSTKAGTVTINVTFEGKATTFTVTVKEKEVVVTPTAVYDLDYPEKTKIIDKTINRTNADCVKAIKKIISNNSSFDVDIAKTFFTLAPIYGIDPLMAISQAILETGWFKYAGSAVTPEHHNYCGLGVTETGKPGNVFGTVDEGVSAQYQHLFAYGCKDALPPEEKLVDVRFKYVTRGIAPYWQQLAGRWAVPGYDNKTYATPEAAMNAGNTYGQKIRAIYNQLIAVTVTDADIQKYFEKDVPAPVEPEVKPEPDNKDDITPTPVIPEEKDEVEDNMNFVFKWLRKIIEAIISVFKKGD